MNAATAIIANEKLGIQHTRNFRIVKWCGQTFSFTLKQSMAVQCLVEAITSGFAFLDQHSLLEAAESDCDRPRRLFRGHSAWGKWIVPAKGISRKSATYTLAGVKGREVRTSALAGGRAAE